MSKNFKGYLGDQIGKLGTAVGRRWKGKMVYASWQGKVRNPRTDSQQLVRARFALLGKLAASMHGVLLVGMKSRATQRKTTESNAFISLNYGHVTGNDATTMAVTYDELIVSTGSLIGVQFGSPVFSNAQEVSAPIVSSNMGLPGTDTKDKVYIAAYSPDMNVGLLSEGVARGGDSVKLTVPSSWQGLKVHVYGFTTGSKRGASNSVYLGSGTLG